VKPLSGQTTGSLIELVSSPLKVGVLEERNASILRVKEYVEQESSVKQVASNGIGSSERRLTSNEPHSITHNHHCENLKSYTLKWISALSKE
jgi:hypothetical protein